MVLADVPPVEAVVEEIVAACESMAGLPYDGEPVDQLAHALQTAALALAAGAGDELVVAALLHDIARAPAVAGVMRDMPDAHHGALGSAWLTPRVGARVAWLAEQHVAAKRYLVAVDPTYEDGLSPVSRETLDQQGGPMRAEEITRAESDAAWAEAVRLRRWDDAAKVPGADVPGLAAHRDVLRRTVSTARAEADRVAVPAATRMGARSRAVVFDGPGLPMRLEDVAVPAPGHGEVVVRITATTLCASDRSSVAGRRTVPLPTVLGHESIGIVEAVGPATHVIPGERVTWSTIASCGTCRRCRRGIPQKCDELLKFGHERLGRVPGPFGGLAERVLLPRGTTVVAVPAGLSDAAACPVACAGATVAGAVRVGDLREGDTVLVTGLGMLGLTACAMASAAEATVLGFDRDPERVAYAAGFGAVPAPATAPADLLLEFTGAPGPTAAGLDGLRVGGRAVLVGAVHPESTVPVDAERVVRRMLRIEGLHNSRPQDLRAAVAFLARHHHDFPFASLVGAEFALEDAEAAFVAADAVAQPRVMVRP